MKIADYQLTIVHIPLATPFITALRRVETASAVRLRIVADDGRIGIGEAPPTEAITGESLASIRRSIENFLIPPMGRPFDDLDEALRRIHAGCTGASSAKAAVDIALHDLFEPLTEPIRIETAVTVSLDSPEKMETQALDFAREGCRILKVKLGGRDGRDIARIRRIRDALPDVTILADANQAWDEAETLRFLEAVHLYDIALLEQPLPADNLAGMAAVTARSPIPILADESAFDLDEVRRVVESGGANMINVKLMKCGGVAKAKEILRWCADHQIACMMGSMLETPASIRAAATLAKRFEKIVRYCDLDSPLLWKSVSEDCSIKRDKCRLEFAP